MSRRIVNFDILSNSIQEDFAWRRKELKIIRDQIPTSHSPLQSASLRFAVPILYAHWEGFVKKSCEYYLEFVANKYLPHRILKSQFIALSLNRKFGKIEIRNLEEKTKTVEFLISELDKNANVPTKNVILTKSNLRFEVFEEIIFILDLDHSRFSSSKSLINDLVDTRNNIAHGSHLRVDKNTYENMHDETILLMEALRTEIENSAIGEKFKKTASA
jgi:hypothetical protein